MSKLCKFSYRHVSLLVDPDTVMRVEEDISDNTCRLFYSNGKSQWVDGDIDEVMTIINSGRS